MNESDGWVGDKRNSMVAKITESAKIGRLLKSLTHGTIAGDNNITDDALKKAKGLTSDAIYPGQELSIRGL